MDAASPQPSPAGATDGAPGAPSGSARRNRPRLLRGPRLNALLFALTVMTTWLAGGWAYCATLMGILVCHEMGHYLTARHYRVKASLPYFIPVPFAFGTFGAVIKMDASIPDRRALVAIGASGPLAGLAVAIPLLFYGLSLSTVAPAAGPMPGVTDFGLLALVQSMVDPASRPDGLPLFLLEGNSILYWIAKHTVFDIPPDHDVWIHPVAFAAWIGLFVTALNMIPVGQLDGGHVAYGLWGERANKLNHVVRGVLLGLGLTLWMGWLVWVVLISFILRASGGGHPPVQHPERPLGRGMRAMAWASLVTLVITFSPTPLRQIHVTREQALALPEQVKSYAGLCDARIAWLYDGQDLPWRERLSGPPDCP
jgi:Zn-dependent protease